MSEVPQYRPLSIEGYAAPSRAASGKAPKLEWLSLRDLVVDTVYQREISASGRKNISRIAENFNWAAFSTVIVAPAGVKGKWAIVDGQHRCTAALLLGMDKVPCQIVDAVAAGQARAFEQINANQTRVRTEQRFYALAAAGDEAACAIIAMAKESGVTIMRYPVSAANMKPGATMMCWELGTFAKIYTRAALVLALKAIATTARPDAAVAGNAGLLNYVLIGAAARAFGPRLHWGEEHLLAGFGSFDLSNVRYTEGLGRHGRLMIAAESIARRLDRWAERQGLKFERQTVARSSEAATGGEVPRDTVQRNGVTLARVPSLEREMK